MFRRLQDLLTLVLTFVPGVFAVVAGAALSAPALAVPGVVTNFNGTLTTANSFVRPLLPGDISGTAADYNATWTTSDIRGGSNSYNYFIQYLEPSVTGSYSIAVTGAEGFNDTLLLIYTNPFEPASPLTNVLAGNDDQDSAGGNYFSRIDTTLTAGVTYVLVMTTYSPGDAGSVDFSVTGAGAVEYSDEEPVNHAPTDITLSNASVNQSGGVNAVVGTLSSTDDDSDTFTYALVSGTGDGDNLSFNISGNALRANDARGLSAASYSVRVRSTDLGAQSYEKAFTITPVDDVAPAAPALMLADDTGMSSTDGIINDDTPAIGGTAEGASSIVVYGTDGTTILGSTTANEAGSWSIVATALEDGPHSLTAKATDAAGNTSQASSALAISIDTAAPTVSSVAIHSATYAAGEDVEITVTLNEDVNIAGSGITLGLTLGGVSRSATFTGESGGVLSFIYTTQNGDATDASGVGVPANGISLGGATIRDTAGNDATLAFAAASNDAAQVDAEGPAVPGTPVLNASSDSGASSSDGITNVAQPTFSGTAEADVSIELYSNVAGLIGDTAADGDGNWSLSLESALDETTHHITVIAYDDLSNASEESAAVTVTIDTTAPAIGGVAFDQATLDGTNQQAASFTLSGAETGSTAHYTISSGAAAPIADSVEVETANQEVSGLDLSVLPDGTLNLGVFLRDTAGNDSAPVSASIAKDSNPVLSLPAAPADMVDGSFLSLMGTVVSGTLSTTLDVTLSADVGTLTADATGGAVIGGNDTSVLTLSGDLDAINAALDTVVYAAPENFSGDANLELLVEDDNGSDAEVLVVSIYDRPDILNLSGAAVVHYKSGAATTLDSNADAGVADADNPASFDGGSLTVAASMSLGRMAASSDLVSFRAGGAVTLNPDDGAVGNAVLVNDGTGSVSVGTLEQELVPGNALAIALNAGATPARMALLLRALAYSNGDADAALGIRTVLLTLNDGTHDNATSSISMTVDVQDPPPDDSGSGGNVIDDDQQGNNYTGNVTVTETGVFNGGSITGTITNHGTVAGEVTLGAGSAINGGVVAGSITGSAADPARIGGATVVAGAALQNVTIGADTVLEPGVRIGTGVKFESEASIPGGLDLTGALRTMNWATGDERSVVMLEDDVMEPVGGEAPMTIIRAIQLLNEYEPAGNDVEQNPDNGEIIVITADSRSAVLPVQVSQAAADEEEGTYIDENGDIVFVTVNRRVVLSYPALADSELFGELLATFGLQLDFNNRANLVVTTLGTSTVETAAGETRRASAMTADERYFSARPQVSAVPAYSGEEGVHYREVPGLLAATQLSFVFHDELGRLMEQDVVPVPADWTALKARLARVPGLGDLRIDTQGIISVTLNGVELRARMAYGVTRSDLVAESPDDEAVLQPVGDANGDGSIDYNVLYPNGDVQLLLIFP